MLLRKIACGTSPALGHRPLAMAHLRAIAQIARSRVATRPLLLQQNSTLASAPAPESAQMPPTSASVPKNKKRKIFNFEWTFVWTYIILLGLVGSQNMNIMRQKHVYNETERLLSKKIDVLESVIERIKNGEEVDIAEELGTGTPSAEREWKELLASLEDQDAVWRQNAIRHTKKGESEVEDAEKKVMNDITAAVDASEQGAGGKAKAKNAEKALPKNVFL
ncbi:hypothetical protein V1525DRAFT_400352 [Lipomyces kononenkoae]|uniref:Uncharacterized protein n=1 Tax=Lipomyces kononenkoae TaxID=34357 RepID=A0ACC3T446_LIPKO